QRRSRRRLAPWLGAALVPEIPRVPGDLERLLASRTPLFALTGARAQGRPRRTVWTHGIELSPGVGHLFRVAWTGHNGPPARTSITELQKRLGNAHGRIVHVE